MTTANQAVSQAISSDPVATAVSLNAAGRLPTKRKQEQHPCELCKVVCCSKDQLQQHLGGQKHAKKIKVASGDGPPLPKPKKGGDGRLYPCEICNCVLNAPDQYQQHVSGLRHRKAMTQAAMSSKVGSTSAVNVKPFTNFQPGGTMVPGQPVTSTGQAALAAATTDIKSQPAVTK